MRGATFLKDLQCVPHATAVRTVAANAHRPFLARRASKLVYIQLQGWSYPPPIRIQLPRNIVSMP